jgi:hypothetical protein
MNPYRALPAFSAAFIIIYVIAMDNNLALFTYHPALKEFELLAARPKGGPAMYWYGWLVTAFLGALVVAAVALVVPERWQARVWPTLSWVAPAAAILVVAFLLRGYFIR